MLRVSYSFVMQLLKGNVPQDEDSMLFDSMQLATSESTIKNLLEQVKRFSSKIFDNMEEDEMEAKTVV